MKSRFEQKYQYKLEKKVQSGEVLKQDTFAVYSAYKEPLTAVKDGYGYMGTVATNKEQTHVQCHICGLFFKSLSKHLSRHEISTRDYKKKFGLLQSTSLIGQETRRKHQEEYLSRDESYFEKRDKNFAKYNQKVKSGEIQVKKKEVSAWVLERRNMTGTCPDQLLEKVRKLEKELNRAPTAKEFKQRFGHLYFNSILSTFGTWAKALKGAGLTPWERAFPNGYVESMLRGFYEKYGRTPLTSDLSTNGLPSLKAITNRYPTLNHARAAAGIPIVIQISKRNFVEVMADEPNKT